MARDHNAVSLWGEKESLLNPAKSEGHIIRRAGLPAAYPTHAHDPLFWESLGRAVATFGFLEETLLRAIFAITATTPYEVTEVGAVYDSWVLKITRSLSDPLSNLIDTYGKAIRQHPEASIEGLDYLLKDLRKACKIRNAICHGSWGSPDSAGRSIPFYVNRQGEVFDTPIDAAFLSHLQKETVELVCTVIDTVTHMGWQFPGSDGKGRQVW